MTDTNKLLGLCLAFISKELAKNSALIEERFSDVLSKADADQLKIDLNRRIDEDTVRELPDSIVYESHLQDALGHLSETLASKTDDLSTAISEASRSLLDTLGEEKGSILEEARTHLDALSESLKSTADDLSTRITKVHQDHLRSSESLSEANSTIDSRISSIFESLSHNDSALSETIQRNHSLLEDLMSQSLGSLDKKLSDQLVDLESKINATIKENSKALTSEISRSIDEVSNEISDTKSRLENDISRLDSKKSDADHKHAEYSEKGHTHSQYAPIEDFRKFSSQAGTALSSMSQTISTLRQQIAEKADELSPEERESLVNDVEKSVLSKIRLPEDGKPGKDALQWEFKWNESIKGRLMFKREDEKHWKYQDLLVRIQQPQHMPSFGGFGGAGDNGGVDQAGLTYTNPEPSVIEVGGIAAGTTFNNTTFAEFVDQLLYPELFPTLIAPSSAFTSNVTGLREIGAIFDITFSASFNRGSITPQYESESPFRSGLPNLYDFTGFGLIDAMTQDLNVQQTVAGYEILKGSQAWAVAVSYDEGVQPKGSKGSDFDMPLPAGTLAPRSVSINGVYPYFATTVDTLTLTKQPLAAFNATVSVTFARETGDGNKQSIEFPFDDWRPITRVQQFNTFTNQFEDIDLNTFDVSEVDRDVNGVIIRYRKYTHNSVTIGSRLTRWFA